MFEPINALLASSFWRNGIIAVATENTILGDTSMRSILLFANSDVSSRKRPETLLSHEMSVSIKFLVSLCYDVFIFFVCCKDIHTSSVTTGFAGSVLSKFTIRSFDKAILIYSCIRCKRVDKTDVWSFRCLYRTHTAIMCIMNISNLESGSVSRKTTRS